MILVIALFLRMEAIKNKTEENEMRISRFESHIKGQQTVMLQGADDNKEPESNEDSAYYVSYYRQKRNVNPTTGLLSLMQVRQEIDKKLAQVCTTADKVCQPGPRGPPGDPGALGYPGYKGEKGAPGGKGSRGPIGKTGPHGVRGKEGPQGQQGIKGEKGEQGFLGSTGRKGDVGPVGRQGLKGSIGLKGNRGAKGSVGMQGPKGECLLFPKIVAFPELLEVFLYKPAIFYCWVRGVTSLKITWSKLGGTSLTNTETRNGVLYIKNVTRSHAGSLVCTAHTSYGTLEAVTTLQLKEQPSFTAKPPSFVIALPGMIVNLCCEAAGSPAPKVEWSHARWSPSSKIYFQQNGCLAVTRKDGEQDSYTCRATNSFGMTQTTTTVIGYIESCASMPGEVTRSGQYWLGAEKQEYKAYCHMTNDGNGWTLIARFSNDDGITWMRDDGKWWYDQLLAVGETTDPSGNDDMISPAFWLISGSEFKITRSDDSSHTPLLQTTGNCLGGQTFRSKMISYGNFRNGKAWSSDRCLGSCTVQFGGQYNSADGFQQAQCSGSIQTSNKIGFWCDWSGDGAVMMIGGGGSECARADHGIGITEADAASFIHPNQNQPEYDFGSMTSEGSNSDYSASRSYSLNLWIR